MEENKIKLLNKNSQKLEESHQNNTSSRIFKKIILGGTILTIVWILYVLISSIGASPGTGMVTFALLLPALPILFVFFPIYFIIIALRYSREKSNMDILDKAMFFILLIIIGGFLIMDIIKLLK